MFFDVKIGDDAASWPWKLVKVKNHAAKIESWKLNWLFRVHGDYTGILKTSIGFPIIMTWGTLSWTSPKRPCFFMCFQIGEIFPLVFQCLGRIQSKPRSLVPPIRQSLLDTSTWQPSPHSQRRSLTKTNHNHCSRENQFRKQDIFSKQTGYISQLHHSLAIGTSPPTSHANDGVAQQSS